MQRNVGPTPKKQCGRPGVGAHHCAHLACTCRVHSLERFRCAVDRLCEIREVAERGRAPAGAFTRPRDELLKKGWMVDQIRRRHDAVTKSDIALSRNASAIDHSGGPHSYPPGTSEHFAVRCSFQSGNLGLQAIVGDRGTKRKRLFAEAKCVTPSSLTKQIFPAKPRKLMIPLFLRQ